MIWVHVNVSDGFPKKSLDGGRWVGLALSKFILDFRVIKNVKAP